MNDIEDLIVLSDIHLSAERDRGLFRADAELAAFLGWIAEETPARVILAGDVFDYLVPSDGETMIAPIDPAAALARTGVIVRHHDEVFDALTRLASSERHELWIMSGNHDPELLFSNVREALQKRMTAARVLRWRTDGEAARVRIGDASILVMHGDVLDDWNRIDHATFLRDTNRVSYGFADATDHDYRPPTGTRIVLDYVLKLREAYPWLDVLKPEREAVFYLLSEFLSGRELWRYKGFLGRVVQNRTESWIGKWIRKHRPGTLVRAPRQGASRLERFEQWLSGTGAADAGRKQERDAKVVSELRSIAAEDTYFDITAPDESSQLLPYFFDRGIDLIVAGHTHAAKAHLVGERNLYLNTGTWGRLLQLPASDASDETWSSFLGSLRRGEDLGSSRPTFARIRIENGSTVASLMAWEDGRAITQASYHFDTAQRSWKELSR